MNYEDKHNLLGQAEKLNRSDKLKICAQLILHVIWQWDNNKQEIDLEYLRPSLKTFFNDEEINTTIDILLGVI